MPYLWIQILFSLFAAALIGGWVAYWWIKRRYEEVTDYQTSTSATQASASGLTREDLNASLTSLKSSVANIQMPDIKPIHARLGTIENRINEPVQEMRGLSQRMNEIDGTLAMLKLAISELRNTDLNPIETRITSLSQLVEGRSTPDFGPISNRLQHIEEAIGAMQSQQTDLGPIHSGLAQLELSIAGLEVPQANDMDPIRQDIAGLEARIAALQTQISEARNDQADVLLSELSGMHTSLSSLTTTMSGLHGPDLNPLHDQISELDRTVRLSAHEPMDLGILTQRLDILRSEIAEPDPGVDGLHSRISGIENAIGRIDLDTLHHRLDSLDGALAGIRSGVQAGPDLSSIEQGVLSLHDMVRNLPAGPDMAPIEQRLLGLQDAIRSIPDPDLTPVISSVHAIEGRLDLGALENRMTSIEYGLAALHHTLRTRPETAIETSSATTQTQQPPSPPPAPIWEKTEPARPDYTPTPERTDDRTERKDRTERRYERRERDDIAERDFSRSERAPRIERAPRTDRQPRRQRETRTASRSTEYTSRSSRRYTANREAIRNAQRPGDEANLLASAAFGQSDDLERISGVGPMLHDLLNSIGVYYFWQVAEWGPREVDYVDSRLDGFNGRIERDNWVGQAEIFADEETTADRP